MEKFSISAWVDKKHPLISTIANVIMAFGTLVAVYIAAKSLKTSNDSLRETQKSITDSQVKDSLNNIDAERNYTLAYNQFIASKNSTDKSIGIAESSVKASREYTNVFKRAMQYENMAYIKIDSVLLRFDGVYYINYVTYTNVGKTPAIKVRYDVACFATNSGIFNPQLKEMDKKLIASNRDNETLTVGQSKFFSSVCPSQMGLDITKQVYLDFWMSIKYQDIFGITHTVHKSGVFVGYQIGVTSTLTMESDYED